MMTLNAILFILLGLSLALTLFNYRKVRAERARNESVAVGLDELLEMTRLEIAKNKKLVEKAKKQIRNVSMTLEADDPMEDPGMLSSILAVIVKKYGAIKLGLQDFESTSNDDYVSVYVDTKTQDLILSLDRGLDEKNTDPMSMVNFGTKDDNTFH